MLIDAGLTLRETKLRLAQAGVRPEELSAILITHEHRDHICGLGAIGRALKVPIYITTKTREAARSWLGKGLKVFEFEPGSAFGVGDLHFEPFSIPHDAVDPVGFAFYSGKWKGALATDLGYASHLVIERLKGANLLVLESNHDPAMLKNGPYPWPLKQRVMGKEGHLSNEDAGRLLAELLHEGMSHVILAHLSQINNLPELAYEKARGTLDRKSYGHVQVGVALQDTVGAYAGVG